MDEDFGCEFFDERSRFCRPRIAARNFAAGARASSEKHSHDEAGRKDFAPKISRRARLPRVCTAHARHRTSNSRTCCSHALRRARAKASAAAAARMLFWRSFFRAAFARSFSPIFRAASFHVRASLHERIRSFARLARDTSTHKFSTSRRCSARWRSSRGGAPPIGGKAPLERHA